MTREYYLDYGCQYKLNLYPFDTQVKFIENDCYVETVFFDRFYLMRYAIQITFQKCKLIFDVKDVTSDFVLLELEKNAKPANYTGKNITSII